MNDLGGLVPLEVHIDRCCSNQHLKRIKRERTGRFGGRKKDGLVWLSFVRYGMVWYSMVWYGMVWYGIWYGVVWFMLSVGFITA